jgi:hypothetical protein
MKKYKNKPHSDKEIKEVQRLKRENQVLRKQISSLRKQLSRVDVDRYQNVCELLESHDKQYEELETKNKLEDLKKKWECFECHEGFLKLILVSKMGEPYYFRKCNNCGKKTKLKHYNDSVEGVTEE